MAKTVAEALALPEIDNEFFIRKRETLPNGLTVETNEPRPFCPRGVSGDDILWFREGDRLMKVVQTPDGEAKVEFRLWS